MSETILEKAAGLVDTFDSLVKTEFDKVEAEAAKLEAEVAVIAENVMDRAEHFLAPVENLIEAAEVEVKKIYEKIVHPEINVSRPVLNHTIGTSQIKNPAQFIGVWLNPVQHRSVKATVRKDIVGSNPTAPAIFQARICGPQIL